jgi:uncharacterized protein (DUF2336 family)
VVSTSASLMSELEAIDRLPAERLAGTLHQITKLFLSCTQVLTGNHIALFDDVFIRLMDRVDAKSLAQLSQRLSEAKNILPLSVRRLVLNEDETISFPILKSGRIGPELLVEVAQSSNLNYRLAIAGRNSVDPPVSEALIKFGDSAIYHALADNRGAKLFEADWARLVQVAENDPSLAQKLGRRSAMPSALKHKIQAKLGDTQMRQLSAMPRLMRDQIENAIATAGATEMSADAEPADYAAAQASMVELNRKGKLTDSTVNRFAVRNEYTNVVAALAFLTGSSVEVVLPLMASDRVDGLVVACKASRLDWATAATILKNRPGHPRISAAELENAKKIFEAFSLSAAQQTVRF